MVSRRSREGHRGVAPVGLAAMLAAVGAACSEGDVVVAPVIDAPLPGTAADPYPSLEEIQLVLTLDDGTVLRLATARRGQPLELPDVPYGEELVLHLTGRIGGSEVAYGRTCPFAIRAGEAPPRPHLYFARTVKWADLDPPSEAVRIGGVAATYRDGSAMFLGGAGAGDAPLTVVDRFDPEVGGFDVLGEVSARQQARAGVLGQRRLVLAGGLDVATGQPAGYLELIDPEAAADRRVERVPAAGLAVTEHAMATLTDGRVIVLGGRDASAVRDRAVEISADGAGVSVRTLAAAMNTPRRGHAATRLSDALGAPVLVTGGRDGAGAMIDAPELFRPLSDSFASAAELPARMIVPRRDHQTARLADDSVLLLGGLDAAGAPVTTLELFSLERGFRDVGQLPADAGVTGQSITALPDRRLLITGGRDAAGNPVASAYIVRVDPADGSIDLIATDSMLAPRAGHQATLLCDGTVLVVGGTALPTPAERYNPPPVGRR